MSYVVYATVCALALAVPILLLRWIVSRFKWLSIFRNREEFLFAFIVASLFGLMIAYSGNREAWFKNELNRRLTPYQGEANSDRTSRRGGIVLWFHFAKDVLKDEDLPTIVEIIKFARTVHWRQRFNLVLDSINVTDAGLRNLESLPEDVHVILMNTSVSREGANWLREKRSFGVFWEEPKSDESKR